MSDSYYRAFEDRYRGSREVITQRLRAYMPFLEPLAALHAPARALDVGCGRGEWLELAAASGFEARGVDLDDGMLQACRERGLAVENADALVTLRAMPDASLAMVSAFHVVEHVPFDMVRELMAEALRVLQPGGLLIFETPNPENLVVGASSFYRDPSHVRPIPPELLAFAAEHAGYARQVVLRLQEQPGLRDAPMVGLHHVLDGASPDYAVVAQKAAEADVLARFDAPFGARYGLSLDMLAHRYDDQAARQRGALDTARSLGEQALDQVAAVRGGVSHLEGHLLDASARLGSAEARLGSTEARLAAAEARADAMGQKVIDMMASTSWRLTRPVRYAGALVLRVKTAVRQGSVGAGLKRRARGAVRMLGQAVLRNRAAKGLVRGALGRFPALQARLRALMEQTPMSQSGPPPASQQPGDLSPRGQQLYVQLKQASEEKER
jgi:SAM-dependent methyltransferase